MPAALAPASISAAPISPAEARLIYDRHIAFVFHSLRRLGIAGPDLGDLAQEVFLKAFQKFLDYDASRPLRLWLFGIAFRVVLDFKRLARHREVSDPGREEAFEKLVDSERSPEEAAEVSEAQRLVLRALDRLDLRCRAVFVMHELQGQPVPQISQTLKVPLNTAYTRLRQARLVFSAEVRRLRAAGVRASDEPQP